MDDMTNQVGQVAPLIDGCLHVTLPAGRCGEFDVKPFMRADFFAALKNTEFFCPVGFFLAESAGETLKT